MPATFQFANEDWRLEGAYPGMSHLCVKRGGEIRAQLVWEVCEGIRGVEGRAGIVGFYHALDTEAGVALLGEAQRLCVVEGAAKVLGPMDGSTWAPYRFAFDDAGFPPRNGKQSFTFEPYNPPEYLTQWETAGFRPAAYYQSRLASNLSEPRPGANGLAARIARAGITVSRMETHLIEEALSEAWPICRDAFSSAPYYREIDFPRFRKMYLGVLMRLGSDFILLARSAAGRLLGFALAVENRIIRSWEPERWVILKTLTVAPDCGVWGLGTHLADEIHRMARERGFTGVVHALMNEGNASIRISLKFRSEPLRRYVLYEWTP
jgi:GNAT superfamily N-acetyltransferase